MTHGVYGPGNNRFSGGLPPTGFAETQRQSYQDQGYPSTPQWQNAYLQPQFGAQRSDMAAPTSMPPQYPGNGMPGNYGYPGGSSQPPRGPEKKKGREGWKVGGAVVGVVAVTAAIGMGVMILKGGSGNGDSDSNRSVAGGDRTTSQPFELLTPAECDASDKYGAPAGFDVPEELIGASNFTDEQILGFASIQDGDARTSIYIDNNSLSPTQKDNIISVGRYLINSAERYPAKRLDNADLTVYAPDGDAAQIGDEAIAEGRTTDQEIDSKKLRFCTTS